MRGLLRLLGSLYVAVGDREVKITSGRERVVLAGLAMQAGETASHDHLCRALWGVDWSPSRDSAYRPAVSRLRKTLGVAGLVVTESFGYRLSMDSGDIDVLAFDALARTSGTATSPAEWRRALEVLTRATALWRGTPFTDIPSDHLRREHAHRLEAQFSLVRAKRAEAVIRAAKAAAASLYARYCSSRAKSRSLASSRARSSSSSTSPEGSSRAALRSSSVAATTRK